MSRGGQQGTCVRYSHTSSGHGGGNNVGYSEPIWTLNGPLVNNIASGVEIPIAVPHFRHGGALANRQQRLEKNGRAFIFFNVCRRKVSRKERKAPAADWRVVCVVDIRKRTAIDDFRRGSGPDDPTSARDPQQEHGFGTVCCWKR